MSEKVGADDPRLADFRHLTDAAARRAIEGGDGAGIFVVEGLLALRQLLRSPYRVRSIVALEGRVPAVRAEVSSSPRPPAAPLLEVERRALADVTGFDVHRGVLAAADRAPLPDPDRLLAAHRRSLVAVGVNDHENIGALFRNAAGLGIGAVLLDRTAADPLYRRSIRVSAGWTMRLPHARTADGVTATAAARAAGLRTVALTPTPDAVPVDRAASVGLLDDPLAFVVGAEGAGLPDDVLDSADAAVSVPMSVEVDSLNVATALAVVAAFAAARRGWQDGAPGSR